MAEQRLRYAASVRLNRPPTRSRSQAGGGALGAGALASRRRSRALASRLPVRLELHDVTVTLDGQPARSSTTIGAVGAYVIVVATTLPDLVRGLTSAYLGQPNGALAASHLHLGPHQHEQLTQHVVARGRLHATTAGACLLDHAAELQAELAAHADSPVAVDVSLAALARAADAWGPPTPHD